MLKKEVSPCFGTGASPMSGASGTTAERFAEYLKETLLPSLSSDDIIIMDNMRSHHAKAVKLVLDASGIRYLYLPPYSLDFNPTEKMWSKIKAYLRKAKVRSICACLIRYPCAFPFWTSASSSSRSSSVNVTIYLWFTFHHPTVVCHISPLFATSIF